MISSALICFRAAASPLTLLSGCTSDSNVLGSGVSTCHGARRNETEGHCWRSTSRGFASFVLLHLCVAISLCAAQGERPAVVPAPPAGVPGMINGPDPASSAPGASNSVPEQDGGTSPSQTSQPPTVAQPLSAGPPGFQTIGPDDLLSLYVSDSPELTRNFRVSADGTLKLPWLTHPIAARGKTSSEIEAEITAELENEQILVHPVVTVLVLEYHSLPVSVTGAVRRPITFQAAGDITLLDAITRAEGLTNNAGPYILVSQPRRTPTGPSNGSNGELMQRIPVKGLIEDGDPTLNMRLRGGEEVRIPEAGRIFVLGNVHKPGAYQITDNGDITVLKLIAQCEGTLPYTNKQAFILRRINGQASRTEIPVPLNDILHQKAEDVRLQSNDIVYIPDNKGRRLTAQTLERMANFGVGTASGYVIFH